MTAVLDRLQPLLANAGPIVGFAAFLAVADFLFWGGAFATIPTQPYAVLQVIGFFTVPCFLVTGGLLVAHAAGLPRARARTARSSTSVPAPASVDHPRRPPALPAALLLLAGCCALASLLSAPTILPPLMLVTSLVVGAGIAEGFVTWGAVLRLLDDARLVTVVGGTCALFPLASLAITFMPPAPAWLAVGALVLCSMVVARDVHASLATPPAPAVSASPAGQTPTSAVPTAGQTPPTDEAPLPTKEKPPAPATPLASLRAAWDSYSTPTLGFAAFGFIAGFSRTLSMASGVNNLIVTMGSPLFVFIAGIVVLLMWHRGQRVITPQGFFRVGVPLAASGLVVFSMTGLGFSTAFACFGNFFFEFMLVVVTIDSLRGKGRGLPAYCLALGCALVLACVGTVAGMFAQCWWQGSFLGFSLTVVICIYVLVMALMLQTRGRGGDVGRAADSSDPQDAPGAHAPSQEAPRFEDLLAEKVARVTADYALTPREQEILSLTLQGADSPLMAERLGLSDNTVRSHKKRLYRKLDVHSKQELLALVMADEETAEPEGEQAR